MKQESSSKEIGLSKTEDKQYHREGWLGPFKLMSQAEISKLSKILDSQIIRPVEQQNLEENDFFHNRH